MTKASSVQQVFVHDALMPFAELRYSHKSQCAYKAHSHEAFSLGAMVEGSTQLTLEATGEAMPLHAGQLVCIEPHGVHRCNPIEGQPRSYFMLYLDPVWLFEQAKQVLGKNIQAVRFGTGAVDDAELFEQYMLFAQAFKEKRLDAAHKVLLGLVRRLVGVYAKQGAAVAPKNLALVEDVRQAYAFQMEIPPHVSSLAQKHHVCTETLIRSFKKHTGMPPKAFLNNARIEKAKRLLKGGASISEVAYTLGFADQSHFQKTFTLYTAATPRQYQRTSIFDKI